MNTDPAANAERFEACEYPANTEIWHLTHSPAEPHISEWWPFTHFGTREAAEGAHTRFLTMGELLGWKGRKIPPAWITHVRIKPGQYRAIRWTDDVNNADASGWIAQLKRSSRRTDQERKVLDGLIGKSRALKQNFGNDLFLRDIPLDPAAHEGPGKSIKDCYTTLLQCAFEAIGYKAPHLILYPNKVEGQSETTSYMTLCPGLASLPANWEQVSDWTFPDPWPGNY